MIQNSDQKNILSKWFDDVIRTTTYRANNPNPPVPALVHLKEPSRTGVNLWLMVPPCCQSVRNFLYTIVIIFITSPMLTAFAAPHLFYFYVLQLIPVCQTVVGQHFLLRHVRLPSPRLGMHTRPLVSI